MAKYLRDFLIYGVSSCISKIYPLILLPILSRSLTISDYGFLDIILSSIIFLSLLLTLQLESSFLRFFFETKCKYTLFSTLNIAWITVILTFVLIFIFIYSLLNYLFGFTLISDLVLLLSVLLLFGNILFQQSLHIVRMERRVYFYLFVNSVVTIISLIIIFTLSDLNMINIMSVLFTLTVTKLLGFILIYTYFKKYFTLNFQKDVFIKSINYCIPLIPSTLINWLIRYGNKFVLIFCFNLSILGTYAVSEKIALIPIVLSSVLFQSLYPNILKIYSSKKNNNLNQILAITFIFLNFFQIGFVYIIPYFNELFISEEYNVIDCSKLSVLITCSFLLFMCVTIIGINFHLQKQPKYILYTNLILLCFFIIGFLYSFYEKDLFELVLINYIGAIVSFIYVVYKSLDFITNHHLYLYLYPYFIINISIYVYHF